MAQTFITIACDDEVEQGSISLDRDNAPGLDITLRSHVAGAPPCSVFKTMQNAQAIELRDALIELYPLTADEPAGKGTDRYFVEEIGFAFSTNYNVVEQGKPKLVCNAYDKPAAERIAAALNRGDA